jgi:hypothetical protein
MIKRVIGFFKNLFRSREFSRKEARYYSALFTDYRNSDGTKTGMLKAKNLRLSNNNLKYDLKYRAIFFVLGIFVTMSINYLGDGSKKDLNKQIKLSKKLSEEKIELNDKIFHLEDRQNETHLENLRLKRQVDYLNLKVDSLYLKKP